MSVQIVQFTLLHGKWEEFTAFCKDSSGTHPLASQNKITIYRNKHNPDECTMVISFPDNEALLAFARAAETKSYFDQAQKFLVGEPNYYHADEIALAKSH